MENDDYEFSPRELEWFAIMDKAGWKKKEVSCILTGPFLLWQHEESGKTLDERIYYGQGEILAACYWQMIAPRPIQPLLPGFRRKEPLFKPFPGG
jgi:hypothetical protein